LSTGVRLLINETVLEDQLTGSIQKAERLRHKDLMAMTIGAKKRTRSEFLSFFKAADEHHEVLDQSLSNEKSFLLTPKQIDHIYDGRADLALLSVKLVESAP
jgi:hypothetical protein